MNKSELKTIGVWIILMSVFMAQLFFYTWCRIQCFQVGYKISEEAERHRELVSLQNKLKIEFARLKSPKRISKIANRLGLANPTPEQMIIIP